MAVAQFYWADDRERVAPMTVNESPGVRAALRSALSAAMSRRDRSAIAVYRSAISAIENAEAVEVDEGRRAGAIEASVVGIGRSEALRRLLSVHDEIGILRREVQERLDAAEAVAGTRADAADRLRHEAELLRTVLDIVTPDG